MVNSTTHEGIGSMLKRTFETGTIKLYVNLDKVLVLEDEDQPPFVIYNKELVRDVISAMQTLLDEEMEDETVQA